MSDLEIFSVDDHVLEPPHTWVSRLPEKYREVGPRVVEVDTSDPSLASRFSSLVKLDVDVIPERLETWAYEDRLMPVNGLAASLAKDDRGANKRLINFDEMRPGCYDPVERAKDMDQDQIVASVAFPSFPRFCGQVFTEADDKDLALLCVRAYNDFMLEEWHGSAPNRHVPMGILPMWDVNLCVQEVERVVARGMRAFTFCEIPARLGLPSVHDADHYWDPLLAAVSAAEVPLCLHIGSSSQVVSTGPDSPDSIHLGLVPLNAQIALFDWLFSGVLDRHEKLKLAFSEGGIGWIPFILERADYTWHHQSWMGHAVQRPPSTYFADHIYGCFIDDRHGAENIEKIGVDNCMIEVDYPHSDTTWPNTVEIATKHLAALTPEQRRKVTKTNAERVFKFTAGAIGTL